MAKRKYFDITDEIIKSIARACIDQKKAYEFVVWTLQTFPEPGWQTKCKKIFLEELKRMEI